MKRVLKSTVTVLLLLLTLLFIASCGEEERTDTLPPANTGDKMTLYVYNWGEYISDGSEGSYDTNAEFEKYCKDVLGLNVEVNYTTYATNEDMYNKIKSGAGSYDIIIPSDYMIQKMAAEGLLEKFDPKNTIKNYEYIDDAFKGMYYDPENQYSVPYSYGVVGVIYNTKHVSAEDAAKQSWGLMWDEKYSGKILQFNNSRDAFGTAMYYMGLDINSKDTDVWQTAFDKLLEQKPLLQGYVSDEIFNKMSGNSAYIGAYYAGDYITMKASNDDLAFYYPKEGTNVFVDAMCIPKGAQNKALATEYINFMLSKDAAIANAEYIGYASPNNLVKNDPVYIDDMGEEAIEILYGTPADVINANYKTADGTPIDPYYHSFTDETQRVVDALWGSLKLENSIELWIHIATAVIVVSILTLGAVSVYRRKKRINDYCSYVSTLKNESKK